MLSLDTEFFSIMMSMIVGPSTRMMLTAPGLKEDFFASSQLPPTSTAGLKLF